MTSRYVLDASAVLAVVNDEPGQDVVRALALQSVMSAVTLAEIHTKLAEWAGKGEQMANEFLFVVREIVSFDAEQAIACGRLRSATRSAGLSLGDRACIALAARLDAEVVTSDRIWAKLALPCRVHLFR